MEDPHRAAEGHPRGVALAGVGDGEVGVSVGVEVAEVIVSPKLGRVPDLIGVER
ncbi:hypothetical protein [Phytomonospora endophytica]|uniref:Uncharacterized protein n=1 Tax=Phytomonospora endophytica TaxID=714109 RepID=A0A841FJZ0_9ACTN|nr:hypothetical protein [Phytomonospora endophytica]MBB6036165.1 hypothetical protein [Phytomonospora endophytica]